MRELTEAQAHTFCHETIGMERDARTLYLQMGARFHKIREERLYECGWESWQSFIMEFRDLSDSSIKKMITIYDVMVVRYGFTIAQLSVAGGWTKLHAIAMRVSNKKQARDWLHKSEVLSRDDLQRELVEAHTGVQMRDCKHTDTYTITICRACKDRIKSSAT